MDCGCRLTRLCVSRIFDRVLNSVYPCETLNQQTPRHNRNTLQNQMESWKLQCTEWQRRWVKTSEENCRDKQEIKLNKPCVFLLVDVSILAGSSSEVKLFFLSRRVRATQFLTAGNLCWITEAVKTFSLPFQVGNGCSCTAYKLSQAMTGNHYYACISIWVTDHGIKAHSPDLCALLRPGERVKWKKKWSGMWEWCYKKSVEIEVLKEVW